ncbi:MAG: transglutaminase-like domain-containing protein [Candidatus Rokuibacteriota bacterium]
MKRRTFLTSGLGAAAGVAVGFPRVLRVSAAEPAKWRTFEVVARIEVADASGATQVWMPLPFMKETDYFKTLANKWTGNARTAKEIKDEAHDASYVHAAFAAGEKAPILEVTSRFSTRDRQVDLDKPPVRPATADRKALARYLKPSAYIPTDGLVLETSQQIVKGAGSDVEKARAIYEWIVDNTFRDPKTKGCGVGDIKAMLETRYLGGKCADLNALYVGLARAAGLPARDVYGVRCADSAEFKSLGKGGDITKAQHCRAEVHLAGYGWVPVDPADVRKVVLEEPPGNRPLDDPIVKRARAKLFGQWEMNWLAYNYSHDVKLPGSREKPLAFLMYPQAETADGRRDSLDPVTFKYQITAKQA